MANAHWRSLKCLLETYGPIGVVESLAWRLASCDSCKLLAPAKWQRAIIDSTCDKGSHYSVSLFHVFHFFCPKAVGKPFIILYWSSSPSLDTSSYHACARSQHVYDTSIVSLSSKTLFPCDIQYRNNFSHHIAPGAFHPLSQQHSTHLICPLLKRRIVHQGPSRPQRKVVGGLRLGSKMFRKGSEMVWGFPSF